MKPALKKTFSAIMIALASLVIVIGIASLAMVQDGTSILPGQDDATATPTLAHGFCDGSGSEWFRTDSNKSDRYRRSGGRPIQHTHESKAWRSNCNTALRPLVRDS